MVKSIVPEVFGTVPGVDDGIQDGAVSVVRVPICRIGCNVSSLCYR